MEHIQILEDLRPLDCEIFPQSKPICYGGGGGPSLPKLPTPDLSNVTKGINQGFDAVGSGLDAIGKPLAQGMSQIPQPNIPMPNLEQVNQGLTHNINQFGGALDTLGKGVGGVVEGVMNPIKGMLGMGGGGGGGAGGGAGAMGPMSGGLARMGASKLQMKKAGMGRRQTYLTKA